MVFDVYYMGRVCLGIGTSITTLTQLEVEESDVRACDDGNMSLYVSQYPIIFFK